MVFAGNFIFRKRPFSGHNYGENPQSIGARNQRPDRKRKRADNFLVRRILHFLAHLKSQVPAAVGKNFASVFLFPQYASFLIFTINPTIIDQMAETYTVSIG